MIKDDSSVTIIWNMWNKEIVINKHFAEKYVSTKGSLFSKIDNNTILNIYDLIRKVNRITGCFNYYMKHDTIETRLAEMISLISNICSSSDDNEMYQHHRDLLSMRLFGNPNKHGKYYRNMFNLVNVRLFIYIINYLNIDERDIFKQYGMIEVYLQEAVFSCKRRLTTYITDYKSNFILANNNNEMDSLLCDIEILAEVCHKKRLLWPEYLQHYSQLNKFVAYNYSPMLGKFTILRFL